ncbi:Aryl-alcohol dehydrogenase [Cladophialophora carrionii]|uniref:Aryl-alcohol dehydrogenase n=1 Tax=Cladophialophora carrionii TaxID=86049 RepID=A0A1C1CS47_9EURO|nr:Aryl-alcohol dehydrogenase [Cladophialophora carrionii]
MAGTLTTTEALVLLALKAPLQLQRIHLSPLQEDEVLVEIHATGICHTDLSCMDGMLPISTPAVLGHEGAGVVLAVGTDVSHVSKGDKVLLSINVCQKCPNCLAGHPNYCDQGMPRNFGGCRVSDGSTTMSIDTDTEDGTVPCFSSFFGQSSFSRHAVVDQSCVLKVPHDTDLKLFAPLGCGISTGVGSVVNTLDLKDGSSLAVFGVGSVGLSAVMAGKLRNAGTIIAIDLNPHRLEVARKLGATHVVHGNSADVVAEVKTHAPSGVNYAVDCTGAARVIETMMECLAVRGRAAQVGLTAPDRTVPIKILQHLLRGQEYVGCAGGDCIPGEMLPYLMDQQQAGNFPLEEIVSYYDAKDHARAFEDSRSGKAIKAVLCWT